MGYLNAGIKDKQDEFKLDITQSFREPNGKSFITNNRYFDVPKFDIDYDKSMVHVYIPYYISKVTLSNWLAKITGIKRNMTKEHIILPKAPLTDKTLEFKMFNL